MRFQTNMSITTKIPIYTEVAISNMGICVFEHVVYCLHFGDIKDLRACLKLGISLDSLDITHSDEF